MADIIIDDDDFGKKGVVVKVIDESTLPTSAEGYKAYPVTEAYSNIYHDLCVDFEGDELNDQIFNRMFNPSIESRDASKALPKRWELKGYRQTLMSAKHLDTKTDVVIKDLGEDYVYGDEHHNVQMLSRTKHRRQPRKDVGSGKSLNQLIVDYIERTASRSMVEKLSEKPSLTGRCKSHQTIISEIVLNKSNPDDVIVE